MIFIDICLNLDEFLFFFYVLLPVCFVVFCGCAFVFGGEDMDVVSCFEAVMVAAYQNDFQ